MEYDISQFIPIYYRKSQNTAMDYVIKKAALRQPFYTKFQSFISSCFQICS